MRRTMSNITLHPANEEDKDFINILCNQSWTNHEQALGYPRCEHIGELLAEIHEFENTLEKSLYMIKLNDKAIGVAGFLFTPNEREGYLCGPIMVKECYTPNVLSLIFETLMEIAQVKFDKLTEEGRRRRKNHLNWLHILLGMIPAVFVGGLFHDYIKEHFFSATTVVWALVAGGVLMIIAEAFRKARPDTVNLDQVTYKQAFIVGLFQCLALWSGFSRSGSTISGGLLVGMNHKTASEFTFILAVPMMVAATGKDLLESWSYLSVADLPLFITGFLTAFVVALSGSQEMAT